MKELSEKYNVSPEQIFRKGVPKFRGGRHDSENAQPTDIFRQSTWSKAAGERFTPSEIEYMRKLIEHASVGCKNTSALRGRANVNLLPLDSADNETQWDKRIIDQIFLNSPF